MSPCTSISERRARLGLVAAAVVALAPAAASAQMSEAGPAPAACAAKDAALPPALAPWTQPRAMVSATSAAGLPTVALQAGEAARVSLHGTREVSYPLQPAKPGGSVAHGGLLQVTIPAAGTYRVALSSGAWVDMVRAGQAVASIAHGHGPACSTIRKMVDYPLTPGVYVLQISANAEPEITVLVAKAP
jgi:hypothetical protein